MTNADRQLQSAIRYRRIKPFRDLIEDAAFLYRAMETRYYGQMETSDVQDTLEDYLSHSRRKCFPKADQPKG